MLEPILLTLKWACFGNAIFMLLWLGYRIMLHHPFAWVLLDALIVVVSLMIAWRYHEDEYI
jgi:hypothetical protein